MPKHPSGTLGRIVERKLAEVARAKESTSFAELEAQVAQAEPPRNFFHAVTRRTSGGDVSVIAEVKRKSPSAALDPATPGGFLRPEYAGAAFRPEAVAREYADAGARAISCLTDGEDFGGELSFIARIKDAVGLPVLRKDFIVDPWQLWESRAAGADAVLLIAECLTEGELVDLLILSQQLQLTALVEVHDMENLLRVRPHVGFPHASYGLLGINNRDLSSLRVDLNHTLRMLDVVDDRSILVSESGISRPEHLTRLAEEGVRIVLVGESLMRQASPGAALRALLDGRR